jgi:hypothetical protein
MRLRIQPLLRALPLWGAIAALTPSISLAQPDHPKFPIKTVIRSHQQPSTVTFQQSSYQLPGSHLREDSAAYSVEADLSPALNLFTAQDGPWGGLWILDIVPRFVVRRADALGSNPVRTPTYEPRANLYFAPGDSLDPDEATWYASVSLLHYSNGQSGPFLNPDGRTLNTVDGSFSLWSVAAAVHLVNDWLWLPAYKALEIGTFYNKENLLDELYPDFRVSLKLETREQSHRGWHGLGGRSRVRVDLEWLVTNPSGQPASLKPAPFAGAVTGVFTPERTGSRPGLNPGFSLFARYYAGYDPYNMNFNQEIYRIDAGLMFGPQ